MYKCLVISKQLDKNDIKFKSQSDVKCQIITLVVKDIALYLFSTVEGQITLLFFYF